MSITPDTKDWTWVLERACRECGFEAAAFARADVGSMIRANAAEWPGLLANPAARERPSDDRWSALEYGCHVRDVFLLYDDRLRMMLEQQDPAYPNWDQDEAAVAGEYGTQDSATVARQIVSAAAALAARFDELDESDWERTGTRSDGKHFTVESFARYLIHDPIHHVHDVRRGYDRLHGRA